ncbi:PEP/pyruvate-binding domain-containing protein [Actinoplanes sp. NPDC049802]|uniref:PEP/pyruvate-binding domain-containing protein n=1 Tax=Actinoplanes sp. NPDC049802 TaxID=3154742 RepID=UPI0033D69E55
MLVVSLSQVSAADTALVGGKAAGLGELIRLGERVPDGFCVTTEAHAAGVIPEAEMRAAYEALGAGPVAVRSSATAEDLADASFAGQHDTVLGVTGPEAVLAAIATCWESLHGARAKAYREARAISHEAVRMAVVVQRMVGAATAGVLFTANPLTGRRTEMMVESATGSGTAVVDGSGPVRREVLADGEAMPELWALGERLQRHRGSPQDIEWAVDRAGELWVLQSRPIITLFPAPPESDEPRVYVEFGHVQGMLRPVTPMGMATLKDMIAAMLASLGVRAEIVDIGGRLYGDLTGLARHPSARKRLIKLMAVDFGPRAQAAMEQVLADPRFAPAEGGPTRPPGSPSTALRALTGIVGALARPDAARARVDRAVARLAAADAGQAPGGGRGEAGHGSAADDLTWPIVAGMLASALPGHLLKGVATEDEIHTVLGGLPHNVTIEMDLALWHLADAARDHRDLLLGTPPAKLAEIYLSGGLPEVGMGAFLSHYGHRAAAEADLGVPRWSEDPAPVFAAIANYLRLDDLDQAPDRRFARAAERAETALAALGGRARRRRPVRGSLALFLLRRARRLAGLRESGKFAGLYSLAADRRRRLEEGAALVAAGRLADPADIMFLTPAEAAATLPSGAGAARPITDLRSVVADRKAWYEAECRRRHVPPVLLSDGTDVEAASAAPGPDGAAAPADVLRGIGASAGRVTGRARIVHDPGLARIEPGEILVAATTDPGWTPLFLTAAALVTETGAIMAHGPTVAREYGLPAVISVPGATRLIADGQVLTVDGAAGTVTVVL